MIFKVDGMPQLKRNGIKGEEYLLVRQEAEKDGKKFDRVRLVLKGTEKPEMRPLDALQKEGFDPKVGAVRPITIVEAGSMSKEGSKPWPTFPYVAFVRTDADKEAIRKAKDEADKKAEAEAKKKASTKAAKTGKNQAFAQLTQAARNRIAVGRATLNIINEAKHTKVEEKKEEDKKE